jgi:hypothetical protein
MFSQVPEMALGITLFSSLILLAVVYFCHRPWLDSLSRAPLPQLVKTIPSILIASLIFIAWRWDYGLALAVLALMVLLCLLEEGSKRLLAWQKRR